MIPRKRRRAQDNVRCKRGGREDSTSSAAAHGRRVLIWYTMQKDYTIFCESIADVKIVPVMGNTPASRTAVDQFLSAPRLMRLGVTEPDGTPLVHPVWYTWEHEQFVLHIGTTSAKRTAIAAQPTVYFTIDDAAPGQVFGVRGKATARIDPDQTRVRAVVQAQCDRYTGPGDNPSRRFLMDMVEAGDLVLAILTPHYLGTWGL